MTEPAQKSSAEQTADILSHAAAEAATPGADTENAYECPFCVMMRKGGCEDPFKAFMACGEKADKGEIEMTECLKEFEALNKCMASNQEVFDGLLSEMKEEEERVKQQRAGSAEEVAGSSSTAAMDTAAAAAAPQQVEQQESGQSTQQLSGSQEAPLEGSAGQHSRDSSSRATAEGAPAAL